MWRRSFIGILVMLLGMSCDRPGAPTIRWLSWLTYREIETMVPAPDGGMYVLGRTTSDEIGTRDGYGQTSFRPFITRLDEDGSVVWSNVGFLGRVRIAVADPSGLLYVIFWREDRQTNACRLAAFDPSGELLWQRRWQSEAGVQLCPDALALAGPGPVVRIDDAIEGLDAEGATSWSVELEHVGPVQIAAQTVVLKQWLDEEHCRLWRVEPDGPEPAHTIEFPPLSEDADRSVWMDAERIVVLDRIHRNILEPAMRFELHALNLEGEPLWTDTLPGDSWDLREYQHDLVHLPADRLALVSTLHPGTGDPLERAPTQVRLRRYAADGRRLDRLDLAFTDDPTDAEAFVACPASDVTPNIDFGTKLVQALSRPDGSVALAGLQHCRNSWIMAVESL